MNTMELGLGMPCFGEKAVNSAKRHDDLCPREIPMQAWSILWGQKRK